MKLTIAIPTYDRNEPLTKTVEALVPQLTEQCELLIIDNCSPTPVSETLNDIIQSSPSKSQVKIIRNQANVGAGANGVRCHELCDSEYVWTLSDDDTPQPDAIQTILRHISLYPECVFFNFSRASRYKRPKTFFTTGLEELLDNNEGGFDIVFMSANVYKNEVMRPFVRFGYHYAYSLAPHLAMLFMSVKSTAGSCCLSQEVLVTQGQPEQGAAAVVSVMLGFRTLLELPLESKARKALWRRMWSCATTIEALLLDLLALAEKEADRQLGGYLFDQITYSLGYFSCNPLFWAKKCLYRGFFICPRFSQKLLGFAYQVTKGKKRSPSAERFTRE